MQDKGGIDERLGSDLTLLSLLDLGQYLCLGNGTNYNSGESS